MTVKRWMDYNTFHSAPGAERRFVNVEVVAASDYDALAAELAEAKKRYSHEYSLVLEGICRKHEARVKELSARNASLEAALRKIAGNGRVPAVSHQFDNAQYRAGYVCGWDNQADIAKAALTPAETACDRGRNSCNHENASQCCGGGHDGDCTCKICHSAKTEGNHGT